MVQIRVQLRAVVSAVMKFLDYPSAHSCSKGSASKMTPLSKL
jgi:hypothetical protein